MVCSAVPFPLGTYPSIGPPSKNQFLCRLTSKEASQLLGIKEQTLRRWRSTGRSPAFIRDGNGPKGRCFYLRSDLEAYISQHRYNCTIEEPWASRKSTPESAVRESKTSSQAELKREVPNAR